MKFLLAPFLLFSIAAFAVSNLPSLKQFKIVERANHTFYIVKVRDEAKAQLKQDDEKKLEIIKINVAGNDPKLLDIKSVQVAPNFYCVIYNAGESGTSTIISEHRCALYNQKELRFEGDIPFQFIPVGKTAKSYPQPVYKNQDGLLKIYDNQVLIKSFPIPKK